MLLPQPELGRLSTQGSSASENLPFLQGPLQVTRAPPTSTKEPVVGAQAGCLEPGRCPRLGTLCAGAPGPGSAPAGGGAPVGCGCPARMVGSTVAATMALSPGEMQPQMRALHPPRAAAWLACVRAPPLPSSPSVSSANKGTDVFS